MTACTGGLGGCLSLMEGIDDVADLFGNSPVTDRASNKSTRVFFSGGTNILFPILKWTGYEIIGVLTLHDRETWNERDTKLECWGAYPPRSRNLDRNLCWRLALLSFTFTGGGNAGVVAVAVDIVCDKGRTFVRTRGGAGTILKMKQKQDYNINCIRIHRASLKRGRKQTRFTGHFFNW